mmetsp:Transcript_12419/g.16115  ORF Transcript_12419/g.16115 Transcript_12419/m.16115 type:complete len:173 (+) Transcript_12419:90-608(+)
MGSSCTKCLEDTGLKGHTWGEGERLGGSGDVPTLTAEERRQRAREAAERRNPGAKQKPLKSKREPVQATKNEDESYVSSEGATLGETAESTSGLSDREKRAAAAKKRMDENSSRNISKEKAAELKLKRQKDKLVGQITHYYKEAGREVPFGLPAASIEKLKKQLEFAKALKP